MKLKAEHFQVYVWKIWNRPSQIHCLNSDGTGDLSLLRYKPDFVTSLFVINELYCSSRIKLFFYLTSLIFYNEIRLITKRILNPNNVFITQNWPDITKKIAEQTNRLPVFRYGRTMIVQIRRFIYCNPQLVAEW
jgi:hypothetical protein